MTYVDAFVASVPRDRMDDYRKLLDQAADAWMSRGALSYSEAVADDVPYGKVTSFPRAVEAAEDELVVISWIVYASRAERDRISAEVMADQSFQDLMEALPIDGGRMIYGGFTTLIQR